MTFGVGFTGGAGAAFTGKPDNQSVRGGELRPEYPGFAGVATAFGPFLELRFFGYVGLELDILFASEQGSATMSVENISTAELTEFDIKIGHSSLNLALLFKVAIPSESVSPVAFIGPLFVSPGDEPDFAITSGTNASPIEYGAFSRPYTMLCFGLGAEINLPVEAVDLRIPLTLRGAVNPGLSQLREERVRFEPTDGIPTKEIFKTEFQYTVGAQLGLAAHF